MSNIVTESLLLLSGIGAFYGLRNVLSLVALLRQRKQLGNAELDVRQVRFNDKEALEREIREFDIARAPISTHLTPHELYLLRELGFEPVQIVFGNVVYSMGWRGVVRTILRAFQRGELIDFTEINNDARVLARNRMDEQARLLGADGVHGVTFRVELLADFMEVTAMGTAVKKIERVENGRIAVDTTPIAVSV